MVAECRNHTNGHEHGEAMARAGDRAIDPVCGMTVDIHAGKPTFEHGGHTYYFCSEGCRTKFSKEPKRFLDKKGSRSR